MREQLRWDHTSTWGATTEVEGMKEFLKCVALGFLYGFGLTMVLLGIVLMMKT